MIDGLISSGQGLADCFSVAGASGTGEAKASLVLDTDAYLPMLADCDLTDEQARELLGTLWQIMRDCVDLGIKRDVCGELGLDAVPVLSNDVTPLDSEDQPR